jgi:hypothetical protein
MSELIGGIILPQCAGRFFVSLTNGSVKNVVCACHRREEEEGLQGVFKRLRRNGHQLEKGLQMAHRGPSLK